MTIFNVLIEGVGNSSRVLVVNLFLNQTCCFTSSTNLKYLLLKVAKFVSIFNSARKLHWESDMKDKINWNVYPRSSIILKKNIKNVLLHDEQSTVDF